MDFVFGTLATDELRLLHHRLARQGVQHADDINPLDPEPGQSVTLTVHVGQEVAADHVTCYYTVDNSTPTGSRGTANNGHVIEMERVALEWDTLAWGYVARWQGQIPGEPDGTSVRYRIGAWSDGTDEIFGDWPRIKPTVEAAAAAFFRGDSLPPIAPSQPETSRVFNYHVDSFRVPDWARQTIIYHVFVDRFHPGAGRDWLTPDNLSGFFGGTLWGVRDQLDYIAGLGADCIWLSPTFASSTHHGYDITDYSQTEPRLGGDDALRALVEAAHARGMRVLLDLVCNHLSSEHPYFQDALRNPASPYRDWFFFDGSDIGYKTFFGVASMPEINLEHPAARAWMIDIGRYWLREFKVDGYRLDHANGPGPGFWSDFRAACRTENPECFLFGEIVEAPPLQRAYVGRLDGLLDFHMEDALRKTFGWGTMTEVEFERFAARHQDYFATDFVMPTFLDNHDMDRFLYIVSGDKQRLRRAAEAQFQQPGPPVIYYGTEVGLGQQHGKYDGQGLEESRLPMLWGADQDAGLLAFYRELIETRKHNRR